MKLRPQNKATITGSSAFLNRYQEFPRPAFTDSLRFPDDLTQLNAANVSELLGKYTQLQVFANAQHCLAAVEILRLETAIRMRRTAIFRSRPTINAQERWRRDAVMESDPDVEAIEAQLMRYRLERMLAETARDNFEKYVQALSRELSRRGYEARAHHLT